MKYNEETVEAICKYIASGLPNKEAAQLAGVSESQFYFWQRARPDFAERVKKARAMFIAYHVQRIRQASESGTWQASAWLLERSFPELFAQRQKVTIDAGDRMAEVIDEYEAIYARDEALRQRALEVLRELASRAGGSGAGQS